MKNVQRIIMVLAMAAVAGLQSCRKEVTPPPAEAQQENNTATDGIGAGNVNVLKKYRLKKQGDRTLLYLADGRIAKVIFSPTQYTVYSWGLSSVVATIYINNVKYSTNSMLINGSGKCYHSTFKLYNQSGTAFSDWNYDYQYNGNQLTKQVNSLDADERYEYLYNGSNLRKINYYDTDGKLRTLADYYYDVPAGDPLLTDNYPLNPATAELDMYMKGAFGKFSTYLPKRITYRNTIINKVIYDHLMAYTLNVDGYVKDRKIYNIGLGTIYESAAYEYDVTIPYIN
jgi:hypothetical protein